jgi:outer membrane lipoprotein-sorting protein/thioredoxin-related protein
MRKYFLFAMSFLVVASAFSQRGKTVVNAYVKKLNQAKALTVSFTSQVIGGVPHSYMLILSKPNFAKIETPWEEIVADGSFITKLAKADKTYFKIRQTREALTAIFKPIELHWWQPFFDDKAFDQLPVATNAGQITRHDLRLTEVKTTLDMTGDHLENFFFDESGLPRQAEVVYQAENTTTLLNTDSVKLVQEGLPSEQFVFSAPEGARQLSLSEVQQSKWFDQITDALAGARATHRLAFVEFRSESSPYSTKLENEVFKDPKFKALSSNFAFCRVDVDIQPDQAKRFNVQSVPTAEILLPNGRVAGIIKGYMQVDQYVARLNTILSQNQGNY